jgi:hypothetical protein
MKDKIINVATRKYMKIASKLLNEKAIPATSRICPPQMTDTVRMIFAGVQEDE